MHFNGTAAAAGAATGIDEEQVSAKGPGGIGSYLARQEFGSTEGQQQVNTAAQDSGYVSHGSGGAYPKLQLPVSLQLHPPFFQILKKKNWKF